MVSKWTIAFTCTLLAFCESAYVDTLKQCSLKDMNCQINLIQSTLKSLASNDIASELGMPSLNPMTFQNLTIPILELMTITVEKGEAWGVPDCVLSKIVSEPEKGHAAIEMTCNLVIKVNIKLDNLGPLFQKATETKAVDGHGNAKLKLDKLKLKFDIFFDIIKKEDGEIYFRCKPEEFQYKYEIGDAKMVVKSMTLGKQDVTTQMNGLLGDNFKFLMSSFGKNFFDVAMNVMIKVLQTFFEKVPAKHFISTDLSPYVKNV